MTADEEKIVRNVERERRKREDRLLLALLLLSDEAQRDAKVAATHGVPTGPVISRMMAGDAATGHPGAARTIARAMAQAHRDGFRRAGLMSGTTQVERADAGPLDGLIDLYLATAQQAADAMAQTLSNAVDAAVTAARLAGDAGKALKAVVRAAFEARGYAHTNSYALDIGAERAIVSAHNAGILHAAQASGKLQAVGAGVGSGEGGELPTERALGIRHVSVLDGRTTEICINRDGLQLSSTHPYWRTGGIPPLHSHCRSILVVLPEEYEVSDWLPTVPPAPGYGFGPAPF